MNVKLEDPPTCLMQADESAVDKGLDFMYFLHFDLLLRMQDR